MPDLSTLTTAAAGMDENLIRGQGIDLIDGTYNGFVLLLGDEYHPEVFESLSKRRLLVFVTSNNLQATLLDQGFTLSWESGFESLDPLQALGFIYRLSGIFQDSEDPEIVLRYAQEKLPGFSLLLGEPTEELLAAAETGLMLGCPLLANTVLPEEVTGWRMPDHQPAAFDQQPLTQLVQMGIEKRRIKVNLPLPVLPAAVGSEFAGQVIRDGSCGVCLTGVELTTMGEGLVDGQVRIVGGDLSADLYEQQPYGMLVEVSGEEMQPDFEPVLERQLDTIFNEVDGLMHRGQRLIASLRVSKKVHANGLTLQQLGELVHASYHNEFGNVLSRVQVTFFTNQQDVETLAEKAQAVFHARDQRLQEMADEEVDTFYTCTTCQSIAGTHVCVISPEHPGVCGAVDWLDARAGVGIRPLGPNKAVQKQGEIDLRLGQWEAVNRLVQQESGGGLEAYSLYSLMQDPGPACGDFDCITAMLPLANGVMVVGRSYKGMTPSGMDWEMLYEMVGGGLPVPGFIGHSKRALHRDKFISAEGGWRRIVWMNHDLREELRPALEALAAAAGLGGFVDLIATEQDTVSEEELLEKLSSVNHPALRMDPLI